MKAPQIIIISIYAFILGARAAKHGKMKTGIYDFWIDMLAATALMFCLWWGGFFA